ncbi:MAG: hypothetical protein N2202_02280 [Proteobacteria bacterium]|nr:hypothetical protein [Pseudomonadota bacterium]
MERLKPLLLFFMVTILEILKSLEEKFPEYKNHISNLISAEVRDRGVYLRFPLIPKLRDELAGLIQKIDVELYPYNFEISFDRNFKEPFLPFTILNSKYKNYIFYIKIDGNIIFGFIVQKNKLLSGEIKKEFLENFFVKDEYTERSIKNIIHRSLIKMYDRLKESWTYLHPLIFYNDCAKSLKLDMLLKETIETLVKEKNDIKRFIGEPYYTFYDLKEFVEEKLRE